jgi:hypothetical protein
MLGGITTPFAPHLMGRCTKRTIAGMSTDVLKSAQLMYIPMDGKWGFRNGKGENKSRDEIQTKRGVLIRFPTTVRTVSGSVGMLSVPAVCRNTPIGTYVE